MMAKNQFDYDFFFSWGSLRLKFQKIISGFTLTERWETGDYHIIFWSVTSKAELSSERPVLFLCLFRLLVKYGSKVHILYIQKPTTDIHT